MNRSALGELQQVAELTERLRNAGFSSSHAAVVARRLSELAQYLADGLGDANVPASAWFVPGRIEVFGKHTDYAGGRSVVAAAERGFCGIAVPRPDAVVHLFDVARQQQVEFGLKSNSTAARGEWSNYPMTVARRLSSNFPTMHSGATIAFSSDLPAAAGMSSSSALMVMTFLLLGGVNNLQDDPAYQANVLTMEDLAGYLGTMENGQTFKQLHGDRGVGTFGGSEDHTAMLSARPGSWCQFSYCPVCLERVISVPSSYCFVIGVSGVVAEKTGEARSRYNRASRCARALTEIWHRATGGREPHMAAIVRSSPHAFARLRNLLDRESCEGFSRQELIDRLEQFVTESEAIIPKIPDVLDQGSLPLLGKLARRSQNVGAHQLGNQIPETVFLAQAATELGAIAASAQGAGFGGSVWAFVASSEAESFAHQWAAAYQRAFPEPAQRAEFFTTFAGPAATQLAGGASPWRYPLTSPS